MKKQHKIVIIIAAPFFLVGLLVLLSPIIFPLLRSIGDYQYSNFSEYIEGYTAIVKKIEENFDFIEKDYNKRFWIDTYDKPKLSSAGLDIALTEDEIEFIKKIKEEHFYRYGLNYIRVFDNRMTFQTERYPIDELVYCVDGKRPPIRDGFTGEYYISKKLADHWYVRYAIGNSILY